MDDYLTGELVAEVRHEYFGGRVFPMPGASDDHNRIAGNLFLALGNYLEGHVCEVFSNDMKARTHSQVFYYPDVMVGCDPRDTDNLYLRFPKLLIEVLSEATERLDELEGWIGTARAALTNQVPVPPAPDLTPPGVTGWCSMYHAMISPLSRFPS